LEQSFVLRDLKTYRKAPDFLNNPRIYSVYPELACELAESILSNGKEPRKKGWEILRSTMKGKVSFGQMIYDLIRMRGAI
ncbi:MAG: FAD-dependent oxidoreductase, partial [Chloroflexi bacterium]